MAVEGVANATGASPNTVKKVAERSVWVLLTLLTAACFYYDWVTTTTTLFQLPRFFSGIMMAGLEAVAFCARRCACSPRHGSCWALCIVILVFVLLAYVVFRVSMLENNEVFALRREIAVLSFLVCWPFYLLKQK